MQKSTHVLGLVLLLLLFVTLCVSHAVLRTSHSGELTVTFLNIGQGDANFIQSPSGAQALIDGGKNRAVIRELSRVMPWFDRSIDVVIGTHPDADHIGGLPDVLRRYRVGLVVHSSVEDLEGVDAAAFAKAAAKEEQEGAERMVATRGQVIDLGGGVTIEILFPDRAVPNIETNTGSVIARVAYGDTAFLLTGDSPKEVEQYLVLLDGKALQANVLKAGHHGSRTSSALPFVGFVGAEYAVFSRGCDNDYGHPHEEVVAVFERFKTPVFDTCIDGRVAFVSDGRMVVRE